MTVAPSDEEASPEADSLVEHSKAVSNVSEVDEGTDDILGGEEDGESGTGEAADDEDDDVEDTSSTVAGSGSGDSEGVWPHDEEYIVEYSLEYGFLRLSPGMESSQVYLIWSYFIKSYLIFFRVLDKFSKYDTET